MVLKRAETFSFSDEENSTVRLMGLYCPKDLALLFLGMRQIKASLRLGLMMEFSQKKYIHIHLGALKVVLKNVPMLL